MSSCWERDRLREGRVLGMLGTSPGTNRLPTLGAAAALRCGVPRRAAQVPSDVQQRAGLRCPVPCPVVL